MPEGRKGAEQLEMPPGYTPFSIRAPKPVPELISIHHPQPLGRLLVGLIQKRGANPALLAVPTRRKAFTGQ
jgi:hypothetical protein